MWPGQAVQPDDSRYPETDRRRRVARADNFVPAAQAGAVPERLAHHNQAAHSEHNLWAVPHLAPEAEHIPVQADGKPAAVEHLGSQAAVAGKRVVTFAVPVDPAVVPAYPPGAARRLVPPWAGVQVQALPQVPEVPVA